MELMAITAGAQFVQGISSGINNYYTAKTNHQTQKAQLNMEAVSLYQQIGSQARQLMNQQALAFINSGVDVSQGTARYVINHTQEQGIAKMNEIKNNLDIQIKNSKRLSSAQATSGIWQSITNGLINSGQSLANGYFNNQNIYDKSSK